MEEAKFGERTGNYRSSHFDMWRLGSVDSKQRIIPLKYQPLLRPVGNIGPQVKSILFTFNCVQNTVGIVKLNISLLKVIR